MPPGVLVAIDMVPANRARLEALYDVHVATTPEAREAVAREAGGSIRAVVTNGTTVLPGDFLARLPGLGIICAQGVGYEGVDLAHARARGIAVTHGPGTNADSVADHAMALMLGVMRDVVGNDALVRSGAWRGGGALLPTATGLRLGVLGLGEIGRRVARRAAGFDMPVAYHARSERPDAGLPYLPSVLALAEWADVLVIAVPGGAATRHMVDAAVLAALGPRGFVVNVGRGSVVDTQALVAALRDGVIAGAGLDVVEGEPVVPEALRALRNVVFSPHIAGRSPAAVQATITLMLANLEAFFAGRAVLTPVPAG